MGEVEVVDRGAREIVVFLSGDVDDELADDLAAAATEAERLVRLNALNHVVVDMHRVSALGDAGITFLRDLTGRGRKAGFEVSFATLTGPAHRAVEAAGWQFAEHSPPV